MLKQGPPPENTRQKKTLVFLGIFIGLGCLISLFFFIFANPLEQIKDGFEDTFGFVIVNAGGVLISAIFISMVQVFVLRNNISKSKILPYISYAAIGGGVGGFVGGEIMLAIKYYSPNFTEGFFVGIVIGAIIGIISSIGQNTIMKSKEEKSRWVWYSLISNTIVWAVGWGASALRPDFEGAAIGAVFSMFLSGLALSVFLPQTSIEF